MRLYLDLEPDEGARIIQIIRKLPRATIHNCATSATVLQVRIPTTSIISIIPYVNSICSL